MDSITDKILYKIYINDVWSYIKRKIKITKNHNTEKWKIVNLFLEDLSKSKSSKDDIYNLSRQYFESKESELYDLCFKLINQILFEPSSENIDFSYEHLCYQDIPFLIIIADSFGRFDLGFKMRVQYCKSLEKSAIRFRSKRVDRIIYNMHRQLFGDELFEGSNGNITIKIPIYLRRFHSRFTSGCNRSNKRAEQIDKDFFNRINKKRIALLAPGILHFDEKFILELKEFDEIIPLTYSYKHYKDFPFLFNISYYNRPNSISLLNNPPFSKELDLEIFCLKYKVINQVNYRECFIDSYRWFLGSPNMGQTAINDLLCQNPNKVKIYGMNFFMSEQTHHNEYPSKVSLKSLAEHNILSNFFYIKKLYSDNLIDLDRTALEIISSGTEEYIKRMTRLYSSSP